MSRAVTCNRGRRRYGERMKAREHHTRTHTQREKQRMEEKSKRQGAGLKKSTGEGRRRKEKGKGRNKREGTLVQSSLASSRHTHTHTHTRSVSLPRCAYVTLQLAQGRGRRSSFSPPLSLSLCLGREERRAGRVCANLLELLLLLADLLEAHLRKLRRGVEALLDLRRAHRGEKEAVRCVQSGE